MEHKKVRLNAWRRENYKKHSEDPAFMAAKRAYASTPAVKAARREYASSPEGRETRRMYELRPEAKTSRREYSAGPMGKAASRRYELSPAGKARGHLNRQRPSRKATLRHYHIKRNYGLDLITHDRMLEAQNNACAICGGVNMNGNALSVDHDHKTNSVRSDISFS